MFQQKFLYRKTFSIVGVITTFFGIFLSLFGKKGRTGTRLCLGTVLISEKNFFGYGGRVSRFSNENYSLWVLITFVDEHLCVSEIFMYRKGSRLQGRYHVFLRELPCLLVPKIFAEEPFSVSKKTPISIKILHRRRKSHFSVGNLLSHSTKKLSRWPISVSEEFRYRKTFCIGGVYEVFLSEIFCIILVNKVVEEAFCIWETFWYRKHFLETGGKVSHFPKKSYSLWVLKIL